MRLLLLDTNAYSAFKKGHPDVITLLQHSDKIGISTIVLGELVSGFAIGSKYKKNMAELHEFLNTARITILPVDETTCTFYAQIYTNLRRKGKPPIPTNDMWIGASALQHGYKLCSFDKHFNEIENLIIATRLADFVV